jgi:hypothetical protein
MTILDHPLTEQEEAVFRLCEAGKLSYADIARQLDVVPAYVKQVHIIAGRKLKDFAEHGADSLWLVPGRARRVLADRCITSRAQARAVIESGQMKWEKCCGGAIFWGDRMIPNVSHKTWAIIYEWAGRPPLP